MRQQHGQATGQARDLTPQAMDEYDRSEVRTNMAWWDIAITAVVPILVAVLASAWQLGGHLASRRRRLNQELDLLSKMDDTFASRDEFKKHIEQLAADYLKLAQRPMSRRIVRGLIIMIGIVTAYAAVIGFIFWSGNVLYSLFASFMPPDVVSSSREPEAKAILGVVAFMFVGFAIASIGERLSTKSAKRQTSDGEPVDQ